MQRTEKRPAARRATVELAVANSSERNNGDGRFLARPKGAHRIGQCGVTSLGDWPFPAGGALPWPIGRALHPSISAW